MTEKNFQKLLNFYKESITVKKWKKGDRIILKGSDQIFSSKDIGELAKEMETKFNTKAIISLEFEDISAEALKESGLPEAKLLPIPK